jgi:energy-coupling factor transporter transmembrane protein EcfT
VIAVFVHDRVMFAVLLFQITMVAVMALRKFPGGFALMLPPPLTLLFWVWYNSKWSQRAMYNPIEQKDIDTDAEERYASSPP